MSTATAEPLSSKAEHRSLYPGADRLLYLAESLLDKCEEWERRSSIILTVEMGTVAAAAGSVAYWVSLGSLENSPSITGIVGVLCSFTCVLVGYLSLVQARLRRHFTRDQRALLSIVDMLREVEYGISQLENLSAIEQAGFRIRLSRFDIGPGRNTK